MRMRKAHRQQRRERERTTRRSSQVVVPATPTAGVEAEVETFELHSLSRRATSVLSSTPQPPLIRRPAEEEEGLLASFEDSSLSHQPLYHRAVSSLVEDDRNSLNQHYYTEDLGDEDEEGDEQRRIEQELDRREVNIVTVPRRKLRVANPS